MAKPSALAGTRVDYSGVNLEQLQKLPCACVDLICIDPPFNSNRNCEVFRSETKEKRSFDDRHENTKACIDSMFSCGAAGANQMKEITHEIVFY